MVDWVGCSEVGGHGYTVDKKIISVACRAENSVQTQMGRDWGLIIIVTWQVKDINDLSNLTDKGNIRHWKEGATNVKVREKCGIRQSHVMNSSENNI